MLHLNAPKWKLMWQKRHFLQLDPGGNKRQKIFCCPSLQTFKLCFKLKKGHETLHKSDFILFQSFSHVYIVPSKLIKNS